MDVDMIKTKDLENIKKIEEQIVWNLKQLNHEKILGSKTGYSCDEEGNINGLNLFMEDISDISFLSDFTNLTHLELGSNQISDLSPLRPLSNLTHLYLDGNQISDLSPLRELNNLTRLILSKNQIDDLSPLIPLRNLKRLVLIHNKISQLPLKLTRRDMEIKWEYNYTDGLFLEGNPLEIPPVEIVKQGDAAVRNYFKEIEEHETVLLLHSKLLIVGSGAVGKTTLMKKLKDNNFQVVPGQEPTTHGINIVPWELQCTFANGDTHPVKIHFWDFGGQDIMYTTHQFFLTKRSLYLFVWEARQEGQETASFDYWLNIIKLLSAYSPVIIVMNKSDTRKQSIDEASFQKKFKNIRAFFQVSCLTGKGIPELIEKIRSSLSNMKHLQDRLPKAWIDVRDDLKKLDKYYISLEEYFDVCKKYGLNRERAEFLSDYLHDLGTILHFRSDALLENTVILDPEWATAAVYNIMDKPAVIDNKGRFHYHDLKTFWDLKKFPREKHPQLIRLMEKFELCFPVKDTDIHIVPELLPAQRPDFDFEKYKGPDSLHFEYHYDFMPRGILSRFISRLYYLINRDHFWKTGVEIVLEKSFALVLSEPLNRRLKVSVTGADKSELLAIVGNHLDHIHRSLNMEKNVHYKEMIPCNCSTCVKSENPHLFQHDVLKKFADKGIQFIHCQVSAEEVPIQGLLKGFAPPPQKTDLKNLLPAVIKTTAQLQGIAKTIKPEEDSRNSFIALILTIQGYIAKDQSRRGRAPGGKLMGELDILVETPDGTAFSVIEAFNLKGFHRGVIDSHFKKIFDYDAHGLENNFLIVYVESANFYGLWQDYLSYLPEVALKYKLIGDPVEENTPYADIKLARTQHERHNREIRVYHLFVNMNV
ncbi:COR domain-containing protein [Acidobacteriota bacterium]